MNNLLIALEKIQNFRCTPKDNIVDELIGGLEDIMNIATEAINSYKPVKMYSEKEVRHMIDLAREYYDGFNYTVEEVLKSLSPLKEGRVYNANEVKELTKPTRHPKGWTALFSDESEWIEYCKWRKREQPISSVEKIKVWMPTIWSAPNQVVNKYGDSVQGVELQEGYFLTKEEYALLKAAPNHLEALERWVKENNHTYGESESPRFVYMGNLLNFINSLK
jgi:hypothetical protein